MKAIDWSQAPEGAVAHAVYHQHHANRGVWILIGHGPFSVNTTPVVADTYGLPPGLTMRPSTDLRRITADWCIESDWIEDGDSDKRLPIERRLQAVHDQLKAKGAAEAELRAEVERLAAIVNATRGTDAQIEKERSIAAAAIYGAVAAGADGKECPDGHWLSGAHEAGECMRIFRAEVGQLRAENSELIEQCAKACEAEAVDAEATGEDGDNAYNAAIAHAAAAIRALKAQP